MGYELFKKKKEKRDRIHKEKPLMVSLEKRGRLVINQGLFDIMVQNSFKKAEILVDYAREKIGLKMLREEEESASANKISRPHRSRLSFLSFVAVKNALKLPFPFVRSATWDKDTNILEFSWKEEKNA